MEIGGYNISRPADGKIIFRADAWRLFQGFLGKVLAIVCLVISFIPESVRLEFESSRITSYATRWGFPVVQSLICKQPLQIKREYHNPTRGFMRSVQLSVVQDGNAIQIIAVSGTSRESLDAQVEVFRELLVKELQLRSELV